MQPIKNNELHYFILEPNAYSGSLDAFTSAYESGRGLVGGFSRPHSYYVEDIDGQKHLKTLNGQTHQMEFFVREMEEVIDCKPYAGSTEFTIGSSKREEERAKYIVGIELSDRCKESVYDAAKEIHMENEFFFWSITYILHKSFAGNFNIHTSKIHADCNFLNIPSSHFEKRDMSDFSYDDNFKYYTTLCS